MSESAYVSVFIASLDLFSMDNNNKGVCKHLSICRLCFSSFILYGLDNNNKGVCKDLSISGHYFSSIILYV